MLGIHPLLPLGVYAASQKMLNFALTMNILLRKTTTIVLLAVLAAVRAGAQPATTHDASPYVPEGYQLDFSDEFDGSDLNTADWKFEIQPSGWVNHELQRYVGKTYRGEKVVFVEDDHLTIRCLKSSDGQIVSGRLNLRPSEGWRYGYFEARLKLPKGRGTWPAFWMMPVNVDWSTNPWPTCGEIDIMEEVGADPNQVSSSIHCEAYNHTKGTQKTHAMHLDGAEDDYHVYGLEWTAERMTFYVDGQVQLTFNKESDDHAVWPFHYAFHPILNLAWGGDWGGYKGVDESALPCEMLVDYVRIYKKPTPLTAKKVVAYVTSWSTENVDPLVMTHINYAFGGVGSDHRSVYADNTARLQQMVALKQKNPALKVLLSVGGWGRGGFSPMAADEGHRKAFAQSCRQFCERYGLDGIDIDWEFPGSNSSGETSPSDEKQNYTLLMRDLREALGADLLLTMASSSDPSRYDFRSCIQYMDFVNVMTYDMASPPNHHSALYRGGTVGNGYIVAHESVTRHLSAGIPADKLVMGLAFYGNSGAGEQISLQQIKDKIASGNYEDHWDDVARVPYLTQNGRFAYGYDDARSLTIKCQYIIDRDLAGGMYWEYANDDLMGTERNTVYDCLVGNATMKENLRLNDTPLQYTGANNYSATMQLEQGMLLIPTGSADMTSADWYYDPDFTVPTADRQAYTFRPVSGRYRVTANFSDRCFRFVPVDAADQPLTYDTTDGTGTIWVIGADGSYGKPTYDSGTAWTESRALPMAYMGNHRHQITFEVGRQLNPDQVNFKFFHQNAFGGESQEFRPRAGSCQLTNQSDTFYSNFNDNDLGNIMLRSGRQIKRGDVYVFTLNTTDPLNAILTTDNLTQGIRSVERLPLNTERYDLLGRRIVAEGRPGLYICDGHVVLK